ncbi:latrophilin-3 [Elysia marginata]|uniref:Latrophilin-3 n=1 Tax=Elysia marginata TaxID=1093978 RepID=A0AAV4H900_9GAST|nr:latrophilin-3 [Elysia marginata]
MFVYPSLKYATYSLLVHVFFFWSNSRPDTNVLDQTPDQDNLSVALTTANPCTTGQEINLADDHRCGVTEEKLPEEILLWNKSIHSREQYQSKFCRKSCEGQVVQRPGKFPCQDIQCFDCICEKPLCDVYGICCPMSGDVIHSLHKDNQAERRSKDIRITESSTITGNKDLRKSSNWKRKESHELPVLKCEISGGDDDEGYLYIQSCPSHFEGSQTRDLCEQERDPAKDTTMDQFARVTDMDTKVTYYNKYCAICNEVAESQIVQWNVTIDCEHFLFVYGATTFDQLLSYSLRPNSTCVVQQTLQAWVEYLTPCIPKWFGENIIGSCNETGLWRVHDEDVETACLQMNERSFQVYAKRQSSSTFKYYKNIFCAICNMEDYPECGGEKPWIPNRPGNIVATTPGPSYGKVLPFSLILGYRRKRTQAIYKSAVTFNSCESGYWSSPNGECLKVHCSRGKLPDNGTCVTALSQIRGLGYQFSTWFESHWTGSHNTSETYHSTKLFLRDVNKYLTRLVRSHLKGTMNALEMKLTAVQYNADERGHDAASAKREYQPGVKFWFQVMTVAKQEPLRDEFERRLTSLIESLTWHSIKIGPNMKLLPRLTLKEVRAASLCSLPELKCQGMSASMNLRRALINLDWEYFLRASQNLTCQYVRFNESYYVISSSEQTANIIPSTRLTLKLGSTTLDFIENNEFTSMFIDEKKNLQVCRDVLDSKLEKLEEERQRQFYAKHNALSTLSTVEKAQYCLTLVCLSASMICLSLTLITYFSFKVLRNQAGLNNIFLCGSLLMAQTFLLTSSHV